MIQASGSTPYYFMPATLKSDSANSDPHLYISGDNIALSPAFYAFLHANEKLGKKAEEIRVVSVGNINELADKIGTQTSLLDWVARLPTLNAPVKKHTMDYMLEDILN
jgi:hypothetical protein